MGAAPAGHHSVLMPREVYPIVSRSATFKWENSRTPIRTETNSMIRGVAFPAGPLLAFGEAFLKILNQAEQDRTRSDLSSSPGN